MRLGTIVYDNEIERYDILFPDGEFYGGLHCGSCLDVFDDHSGQWIESRIEYNDDHGWYLIGIKQKHLSGLQVRL